MTPSPSQPESHARWLASFRERHGRAPRILHVGNIANNGYNNAKVLRAAGWDCDVLSYDYYHIMGCPEWEDADFEGDVGDQYVPDWRRVELRGFERPRWFAQGPLRLSMRYLLARRRGQRLRAWFWWKAMAWFRWANANRQHPIVRASAGAVGTRRHVRRVRSWRPRGVRSRLAGIHGVALWRERITRRWRLLFPPGEKAAPRSEPPRETPALPTAFDRRASALIEDYRRRFPDREDMLTQDDMEPYRHVIDWWRELFDEYDLVEAYSTDPILPMLAGSEPYIAYEHGTIREIPFDGTSTGRLTALAYARAWAAVITNPDCVTAADRLGVGRRRAIPHLIDHKYYDPELAARHPLPPGVRPPYIFCPARHDWATKGTDILLEAFAQLAEEREDVQLVMAAWGADLERSLSWLEERDLGDRVVLCPPLHIHGLIRVARSASVIVDQFKYGVFGGIGPTALAVGTPLVTHIDHGKSAWCMSEPPVFDAVDVPTCLAALRLALDSRRDEMAAGLHAWMRGNYWWEDVATRHAELFMDALGDSEEEIRITEAGRSTPDVVPTAG